MIKLEEANKHLNLLRNKAKREYGFAYLAWLKNGCVGQEPKHWKLSNPAAQAVRIELERILVNPLDIAPHGRR